MTASGIEPATFRFVAQHLNHCATAVSCYTVYVLKRKIFTPLGYYAAFNGSYRRLGTAHRPHLERSSSPRRFCLDYMTVEGETDRLSLNVSN